MKFIFLDIDGVLVTRKSSYSGFPLDPAAVKVLTRITHADDVQVVISSARRISGLFLFSEWLCNGHPDAHKIVKAFAPEWCTPDLRDGQERTPEGLRAAEILLYCLTHNVSHSDCLVLDDLDLREVFPDILPFVHVNPDDGFSMNQIGQLEDWALSHP